MPDLHLIFLISLKSFHHFSTADASKQLLTNSVFTAIVDHLSSALSNQPLLVWIKLIHFVITRFKTQVRCQIQIWLVLIGIISTAWTHLAGIEFKGRFVDKSIISFTLKPLKLLFDDSKHNQYEVKRTSQFAVIQFEPVERVGAI